MSPDGLIQQMCELVLIYRTEIPNTGNESKHNYSEKIGSDHYGPVQTSMDQ